MAVAPSCRLYLVTPPLGVADLAAFAPRFAAALAAGDVASALVRVAPEAQGDAKRIAERMVEAAARYDAAILIEGEPRLAARVGADGAHVTGVGDQLSDALASLRPERIVGVGALRGRDDAMAAGEAGADYLMFGEPRRDGWRRRSPKPRSGSPGGRRSSRRRASPMRRGSTTSPRWRRPAPTSSRSAKPLVGALGRAGDRRGGRRRAQGAAARAEASA